MSQLEQLVERGAYVNAGHLDLYDGKHTRLGDVTSGGDLVLSVEGEAYVASLPRIEAEDAQADAHAAEVEVVAEAQAASHDEVVAAAEAIIASAAE